MKTMYEQIEETEAHLETISVPKTPFTLLDYLHGRCDLFALALYLEMGFELVGYWDNHYLGNGEVVPVLIHTYCEAPNGEFLDVRGIVSKKMLLKSFDYDSPYKKRMTHEQIRSLHTSYLAIDERHRELTAIRTYIREHSSDYQFNMNVY